LRELTSWPSWDRFSWDKSSEFSVEGTSEVVELGEDLGSLPFLPSGEASHFPSLQILGQIGHKPKQFKSVLQYTGQLFPTQQVPPPPG
jgi:hypothetical protein